MSSASKLVSNGRPTGWPPSQIRMDGKYRRNLLSVIQRSFIRIDVRIRRRFRRAIRLVASATESLIVRPHHVSLKIFKKIHLSLHDTIESSQPCHDGPASLRYISRNSDPKTMAITVVLMCVNMNRIRFSALNSLCRTRKELNRTRASHSRSENTVRNKASPWYADVCFSSA